MRSLFGFALALVICANVLQQEITGLLAMPLYTNSRWIVNEKGRRVKLSCVNLPSHTVTVLAEGLNKIPLDMISKKIVANGFNCVRFTWPLTLATDPSLASTTVRSQFERLGLDEAIAGIQVNNPNFLNFTLIQAFQAVIENFGDNNVMVILDNHLSRPGWCCGNSDDGFFGEQFFDPKLWLKGLTKMATMFKNSTNVIGMSLRNELRGPHQNVTTWHRYMQRGAEAVHLANRHMLVIISGLAFDNDLSFLKHHPVTLKFTRKIVFEVHRFGVSIGQNWANGNPNDVCGNFARTFKANAGFLLEQGYPLFLSEFGGDQSGNVVNDNRFLNCVFGVIAELDLDWALWALQGSYYLRENVKDLEETWGVLNRDWTELRNVTFMLRVISVQAPFQGPDLFKDVAPYNIIYHPSTGLCIHNSSTLGHLRLSLCELTDAWTYDPRHKRIVMNGTEFCLQAVGLGEPIALGTNCTSPSSRWDQISASGMHLVSKLSNGLRVCMDVESSYVNGVVVTRQCSCLRIHSNCDPASQWFDIVNSQREIIRL